MADQSIKYVGKAEAVQPSIGSSWVYKFAKRHGPNAQRKHWRPTRKGWAQWVTSDSGVETLANALIQNDGVLMKSCLAFGIRHMDEVIAHQA